MTIHKMSIKIVPEPNFLIKFMQYIICDEITKKRYFQTQIIPKSEKHNRMLNNCIVSENH